MGVADLNVQIQLEGAAAFQRALSELGKKEADKIRRAAITKARKNLAHIIEFGRRPFFMRIRGRNGTRYSVKVPGTRGDRFLTRTAERHLRGLDKRMGDRMLKSLERRLRKLEKTRGAT